MYRESTKYGSFLSKKNAKITKRSHSYKGYPSSHNIDILNSFNPELQREENVSSVRNKLISWLSEPSCFKFKMILVVVFESDDATNYTIFCY